MDHLASVRAAEEEAEELVSHAKTKAQSLLTKGKEDISAMYAEKVALFDREEQERFTTGKEELQKKKKKILADSQTTLRKLEERARKNQEEASVRVLASFQKIIGE